MVLPVIPEPPYGDFIQAQFHPRIYRSSWRPFELAQYGPAIGAAVQELEDAVKEATFGAILEPGVELMQKAFDVEAEEGTLIDKESSAADQSGMRDLFVGFVSRYKGLPPHSVFSLQEVSRVLALASYLMYTVDLRKPIEEKEKIEFELLKDDATGATY